jgi:hypothetical protein
MRFLLESNVYDQLVVTPERQIQVINRCEAGAIELLMTDVEVDSRGRGRDRHLGGAEAAPWPPPVR